MSTAQPLLKAGLRLDGKTVLITGSGGGIGAGIAEVLGSLGAVVGINDVDPIAAGRTVDAIESAGGRAFAAPGNVTDDEQTRSMIDRLVERTGRLDGLVNNAGIAGPQRLEEIGPSEWSRVLAVNLTAPFRLCVHAAPHLRAAGAGRIVNIASIAGIRVSVLGGAAYTTSKAGLIGMTRHLAMEFARDGITVNAILPGVTMTPLVQSKTTAPALKEICNTVPVGRVGTPIDVGWLTAFLLSDVAGYISGTATEIDGAVTVLPGDFASYQHVRQEASA